jgi:hypothetical protein
MEPKQYMHAHILFLDQLSRSCVQQTEIARLVDIGVLEEDYTSEWASPTFAIAKKWNFESCS